MPSWLLAVVVALGLAGCDDFSHLGNPPQTLVVQVNDPKDVQTATRVLMSRFGQYRPSIFSSMRSEATDRTIRFTFERGAPRPDALTFMTTNRGILVARTQSGAIWFQERDVVDAVATYRDGTAQLALMLSDEAGARVDKLSRQSVGEIVTVTLDGLELTSARVQEPLGKRLTVSVSRDPSALVAITYLLRSGPLPEGVRIAGPGS